MAHTVADLSVDDPPNGQRMYRSVLRVVFAMYIAAVLLITQWPDPPDTSAMSLSETVLGWLHQHGLPQGFDITAAEAVANIIMFVPFGVLLPLVASIRLRPTIVAGAVFSTLIELSQLAFLPNRFPTVQDVVMNTLGAAIGAAIVLAVRAVRAARASAMDGGEVGMPALAHRVEIPALAGGASPTRPPAVDRLVP